MLSLSLRSQSEDHIAVPPSTALRIMHAPPLSSFRAPTHESSNFGIRAVLRGRGYTHTPRARRVRSGLLDMAVHLKAT